MATLDTYNIGDEVECIREFEHRAEAVGRLGKIIDILQPKGVTVEFYDFIDGHNGDHGQGQSGHCWNFFLTKDYLPKYLKLIKACSMAKEIKKVTKDMRKEITKFLIDLNNDYLATNSKSRESGSELIKRLEDCIGRNPFGSNTTCTAMAELLTILLGKPVRYTRINIEALSNLNRYQVREAVSDGMSHDYPLGQLFMCITDATNGGHLRQNGLRGNTITKQYFKDVTDPAKIAQFVDCLPEKAICEYLLQLPIKSN